MSAYGAIAKASSTECLLPSTVWIAGRSSTPGNRSAITIHHLTHSTAQKEGGLIGYLGGVMAQVIEDGRTYPQEVMPLDAFEGYFFAGDVFLAIARLVDTGDTVSEGAAAALTLDEARGQRSWEECVAGYYYVKPNYPGRSSHICNGGFVVPPIQRGHGYGSALAKSFLHYAPKLGYQASVFNLVYTNNTASVKLWEGLNFQKAGLIPKAGRLVRADGAGEEYVDAWVFYKSFADGNQ